MLLGFFRVGEKGAIIGEQQLSDELLSGFRACEETTKVGQTAVCSETDEDAVWQVFFCLKEQDAKENGGQGGARTHPCMTPLDMGKLPDKDPLCFTRPC